MTSSVRTISVQVIGDASNFERALAESSAAASGFGARMDAIGSRVQSVGKSLTTHLTLPIVAAGTVATKMAVDFQASMELIHTQAGASQKAVDSFGKSVLAMSGSVGTGPKTLSEGLFHLASQGLKGAQALDALKVAAEGAKVGQANLEDVTNALGAAVVSGIKGSQNYKQAMGALNATVGAGDMHMQDLADAMGTGLPAKAHLAGVSLRDLGAALAVFGDSNIRGAKAGTDLASAIRLMSAPSKTAAKELAGVGLSSTQLADDMRNHGLVSAFADLKSHMDAAGLSANQQNILIARAFGGKQATGVSLLLDQLDRLKTKTKEVGEGANTFGAAWKATTETTAFKFAQLKASLEAAAVSIGNVLMPAATKVADALAGLAERFAALPKPVQTVIVVVAGVVAALGPIVFVAGSVVTAIGAIGTALEFLAANPIVLVAAGIALLAGAIAAAVLAPQKLEAALETLGLSAATSAKIVDGLRAAFGYLEAASGAVVAAVQANWPQIRAVIVGVVDIVKTSIRDFVTVGEALWRGFGATILAMVRTTWGFIANSIRNDLTVIRGVVDVITGLIHGDWGKAWTGLKLIVSGTVKEMVAIVRTAASLLGAAAKLAGEGLLKGLEFGIGKAVAAMKALPGKLVGALGSLGGLLVAAGENLIGGLIRGIESKIGAVKDSLVGLTHKLASWKGPEQVDAALLYPAGRLIIGGLITGLESRYADVRTSVHNLTRQIADVFGVDVPRLKDGMIRSLEVIDLPMNASLTVKVKTQFVNVNGQPMNDDWVQSAIQASIATRGFTPYNPVTGDGTLWAYSGPTMPDQYPTPPSVPAAAAEAVGASLGGNVRRPGVQMLADGGIVTSPTLAMIGEAGPEAVIPLSSSVRAASGKQEVVLQVDGRELARAVVDGLSRSNTTSSRKLAAHLAPFTDGLVRAKMR